MPVKWNPNNPANQTPWTGHQPPENLTQAQQEQYWKERQHAQTAAFVRNTTGSDPDWAKRQ